MGLLVLVYFVIGILAYHALFDIWYLDFKKALIKEIFGAFLFSALMTGITLKYWFVSVVIILVMGVALSAKCARKQLKIIIMAAAVIFALIVVSQARNFNKNNEVNNSQLNSDENSSNTENSKKNLQEMDSMTEDTFELESQQAEKTGSTEEISDAALGTVVYGIYQNYNESYICDAEVGMNTDDETDYVYLSGVSSGGHGAADTTLVLNRISDGTYAGREEGTCETEAVISFSNGEMIVEITYSENEDNYNLSGTYKLITEMDFNDAG